MPNLFFYCTPNLCCSVIIYVLLHKFVLCCVVLCCVVLCCVVLCCVVLCCVVLCCVVLYYFNMVLFYYFMILLFYYFIILLFYHFINSDMLVVHQQDQCDSVLRNLGASSPILMSLNIPKWQTVSYISFFDVFFFVLYLINCFFPSTF